MEQLKSIVSDLKQKREVAATSIDPESMEFYGELRKQKGIAVAKVEQGTCRGCRISLSTAELQKARSGSILRCGSCRRILFLP
ncbi:C4-type zinc ribbon domain-containing protein, partial [Chloroflexota bacterium]